MVIMKKILRRKLFMDETLIEQMINTILDSGVEAIDDFLGYEHDVNEDKDTTLNRMQEVADQMPNEELIHFYRRYVPTKHSFSDPLVQNKLRDLVNKHVFVSCNSIIEYMFERGDGPFSIDDIENYDEDIYEWYFVSEWFSAQLAKFGEPVIRTNEYDIWGRTCTGQAVYMDGVILRITELAGYLDDIK
jgi:hypothetical protein